MIINGIELEFNLYDLENPELKERYGAELEKMKHVSEELPEGTALEQNKFLCGRVKQMFDAVFGKGTGDRVCGRGNDLLTCMVVYEQLITEQIRPVSYTHLDVYKRQTEYRSLEIPRSSLNRK